MTTSSTFYCPACQTERALPHTCRRPARRHKMPPEFRDLYATAKAEHAHTPDTNPDPNQLGLPLRWDNPPGDDHR